MLINIIYALIDIFGISAIPSFVIWTVAVFFGILLLWFFITVTTSAYKAGVKSYNDALEENAATRQLLHERREQFNPLVRWFLKF